MTKLFSRLKAIDFYKKIPSDLTEATLTGAWLSIVAAVIMVLLLGLEFGAFLATKTATELVVDRSPQNELLKVNFNISFPALSCEFATLDVSDALGTKRMNLTRTVKKAPINALYGHMAAATDDTQRVAPKYDEPGTHPDLSDDELSRPISAAHFQETLAMYPIVIVNFFAPWCHWCQRLAPTWEAATKAVHDKYPEHDGRIRLAKVDCTQEVELCRRNVIQAFPSVRVFRKGHDELSLGGRTVHEAYTGDRTLEALVSFAEGLLPAAGEPHRKLQGSAAVLQAAPRTAGCNMAGFVMVKKVPGTLHFTVRGEGHTFDPNLMNLTHHVHAYYFGARPSPRKERALRALHPSGLRPDWQDKLTGQGFLSDQPHDTHEHFMQVVMTTVEPRHRPAAGLFDAYEYTIHSHSYVSDAMPAAKFSHDMSPVQIVVREEGRRWYHFLTTTCAIIGGVFTVAGILDAILYSTFKLAKKLELGKQI